MAVCQCIEAFADRRSLQPCFDGVRPELHEDALAPVLDSREPRGFQRDLSALDIGVILPVNIRCNCLKTGEPDQGKYLPEPVELDNGLDTVGAGGATPSVVGQAPRVKVGIDGDVITESLRGSEQRIQLDLLHRSLVGLSSPAGMDCVKHLLVRKLRQLLRHLYFLLHEGEPGGVLDDVEIIPKLGDDALHGCLPVRQRQHCHHLREVGVRGCAN
jgi:hypothetical protein